WRIIPIPQIKSRPERAALCHLGRKPVGRNGQLRPSASCYEPGPARAFRHGRSGQCPSPSRCSLRGLLSALLLQALLRLLLVFLLPFHTFAHGALLEMSGVVLGINLS